MKILKYNFLITILVLVMGATAQSYRFVEASSLTMVGKMFSTPNPYNRVDTVRFKGFTPKEQMQVIDSIKIFNQEYSLPCCSCKDAWLLSIF